MKFSNRLEATGFAATLAVAFLLIISPLISVTQVANSSQPFLDGMRMRGDVTIYVDGVEVEHVHNAITYQNFAALSCRLYNDSQGCSDTSPNGDPDLFNNTVNIALTGIGVSTDTTTPTQSNAGCAGLVTTNGLEATIATTSYDYPDTAIILSASWVATGAVASIDKACLFAVQGSNIYSGTSGNATYASTKFTAVSLAGGQSLGITWTINFQ